MFWQADSHLRCRQVSSFSNAPCRADNLLQFVDRITNDIGNTSAILRDRSEKYNSGWFDTRADNLFWFAYGQLYAYYGILSAARADFRDVIAQRDLGELWRTLEEQLRAALTGC